MSAERSLHAVAAPVSRRVTARPLLSRLRAPACGGMKAPTFPYMSPGPHLCASASKNATGPPQIDARSINQGTSGSPNIPHPRRRAAFGGRRDSSARAKALPPAAPFATPPPVRLREYLDLIAAKPRAAASPAPLRQTNLALPPLRPEPSAARARPHTPVLRTTRGRRLRRWILGKAHAFGKCSRWVF